MQNSEKRHTNAVLWKSVNQQKIPVLHSPASHHQENLPALSPAGMDCVAVMETFFPVADVAVSGCATDSGVQVSAE